VHYVDRLCINNIHFSLFQVAALELQEQLQLCGISGYKTHVKDIIYIPHADKVNNFKQEILHV